MDNKDKIAALEKSLGTKLPANSKIEIVIHDLDAEGAEDVKGGGSFSSFRTVSVGTLSTSTATLKAGNTLNAGNILSSLGDLACW